MLENLSEILRSIYRINLASTDNESYNLAVVRFCWSPGFLETLISQWHNLTAFRRGKTHADSYSCLKRKSLSMSAAISFSFIGYIGLSYRTEDGECITLQL